MAHLDDYDDYDYQDGDGGQDEDDEMAMQEALLKLRTAMGNDLAKIPRDKQEETLYNFYYDVEKSASYLRKKFLSSPATPQKTGKQILIHSRHSFGFDSDTTGAGEGAAPRERMSFTAFFADTPWLRVPAHRLASLTAPERPRGGLLGGAENRMSKLQALAASRKKKTAEKKVDKVQDSLSKVSLEEPSLKENKRLGTSESSIPAKKPKTPIPTTTPMDLDKPEAPSLPAKPKVVAEVAKPSAFAQTLFSDTAAVEPPPDGSAHSWDRQSNVSLLCTPKSDAPLTPAPPRPHFFRLPYLSWPHYNPAVFDKPSPDDIVLAAQAKAGQKDKGSAAKTAKTTKVTPPKGGKDSSKTRKSSADVAAKDLEKLKLQDLTPKGKRIDVVKEFETSKGKRNLSFVVVGHVDAGKSTLMGRLLLELKYVNDRTINKYRSEAQAVGKKSFALAWVTDNDGDERSRGVTIDIATNHFETKDTAFTILDAPGHQDFIPNMIAGASQADFAVVVIDGNTGAYEKGLKGQTREHVLLLRGLGVSRLVVAVNKLDMVGWSQERFEEIRDQFSAYLKGLGFLPKKTSFVPISGLNGDNMVKRSEDAGVAWYAGETFVEALEKSESSVGHNISKPLRMSIFEIHKNQMGGSMVSGRIEAGTIQIGDPVAVLPNGAAARVKAIAVDKEERSWAVAGQSAGLTLADADFDKIKVGDVVCAPASLMTCSSAFTMKAMAFEFLTPGEIDVHRSRLHSSGKITAFVELLDKATGKPKTPRPGVIQEGEVARIKVRLDGVVPLEAGQRVVLRSRGLTVAAGLVE